MQLTAVLMAILSPPQKKKNKGHNGRNKKPSENNHYESSNENTPVCVPILTSAFLHYSFADSKTNINISNININSHETLIPLQN